MDQGVGGSESKELGLQFRRLGPGSDRTAVAAFAFFFTVWYILLLATVFSKSSTAKNRMQKVNNLALALLPFVIKIGSIFGISKDRLGMDLPWIGRFAIRILRLGTAM